MIEFKFMGIPFGYLFIYLVLFYLYLILYQYFFVFITRVIVNFIYYYLIGRDNKYNNILEYKLSTGK